MSIGKIYKNSRENLCIVPIDKIPAPAPAPVGQNFKKNKEHFIHAKEC